MCIVCVECTFFLCVGGDCEFCGRTEPFSVDVLKKDALEVNDAKLEHFFFFLWMQLS